MTLIAAADQHWAIGNKGALLIRIPADMKRFGALTTGKVVVYGRKTLDTFPQKQPLRDRVNLVLSKNSSLRIKNTVIMHSCEEVLEAVRQYDSRDVFVIGGESVYRLLLPYCDTALITRIDYAYAADAHMPDLDADPDWELTEVSDEQYYNDITYHYVTYKIRRGQNHGKEEH